MPQSKRPDIANTKSGGIIIMDAPNSTVVIVRPDKSVSYTAAINPPIREADIFSSSPSENHLRYTRSLSSFLSAPATIILKKTTITDIIE